jgi:FHA domain
MARFSVYFKDKWLSSFIYDTGIMHIGRDESNDLIVDSLAIAPAHAVVAARDNLLVIRPLDDRFPLLVNSLPTKEHVLNDNDVIDLGKHYIVFNTMEALLTPPETAPRSLFDRKRRLDLDVQSLSKRLEASVKMPVAQLQIMAGMHIGRVLPIKKAVTRLGQEGGSIAVLTHRNEGFYISALQGAEKILVNRQPLTDQSQLLNTNDVISVDNIPMQFFQD